MALTTVATRQDEKGDVILKYTSDEARNLKAYGELPETAKVTLVLVCWVSRVFCSEGIASRVLVCWVIRVFCARPDRLPGAIRVRDHPECRFSPADQREYRGGVWRR